MTDEALQVPHRTRGWTFDAGIPELIEPFAPRKPFRRYRRLLTASPEEIERWRNHRKYGGALPFLGLGRDAAAELIERLPVEMLLGRTLTAPTLGTLLRSAVAHPDQVELSGRVLGPDHPDEGVRIDGVILYTLPDLDLPLYGWTDEPEVAGGAEILWRVAREEYGLDDALTCFESIRACEMGFGMAAARRGWWLRWYALGMYEDGIWHTK